MAPQIARLFEGRKFMWDGKLYESQAQAEETARAYSADTFDARVLEDEGRHLVYSRRDAGRQAPSGG